MEDIIDKIEGEDEEDDALEGGDEVEMDAEVEVEEDPFAEEGGEEELAESDEKGVEEKDCKTLIKQLTKAIQQLELMDMMPNLQKITLILKHHKYSYKRIGISGSRHTSMA